MAEEALDYLREAAVSCMKCGFCKAVCPVHVGPETTSPRARVRLARAYADGVIGLSARLKSEVGNCINCKACRVECPSGVAVDRIVLDLRRRIVNEDGLSRVARLVYRRLLSDPSRLAGWARGLGLMSRLMGLANPRSPFRLAFPLLGLPADKRLPPLGSGRPFRASVPEVAEPLAAPRLTAVYFVGCAADLLYPEVAWAVWRVLRRLGCRVIVPREMVCCGTPVLSAGDSEGARALALRNIEILSQVEAHAVVTSCGSCGLTISREWGEVLGVDVPAELESRVVDLAALISALAPPPLKMPSEMVATYHDPCHLRHGMGVYEEPRALLKSIAGLRFVEMEDAERCCGGGGAFCIHHPKLSRMVGAQKARSVMATGAEAVVTGCPACLVQLDECLRLAGSRVQVLHLAQVIDQALSTHPL